MGKVARSGGPEWRTSALEFINLAERNFTSGTGVIERLVFSVKCNLAGARLPLPSTLNLSRIL